MPLFKWKKHMPSNKDIYNNKKPNLELLNRDKKETPKKLKSKMLFYFISKKKQSKLNSLVIKINKEVNNNK
jgi:hypothetical protein